MHEPPEGTVLVLAAVLTLASGCGDVLDSIPPRPAAIADPATAAAAFPDLAEVPARPTLTYSLEQRREIAEGLVADRANARYAGDNLRAALDRPVPPDTAPPLPPFTPSPVPLDDPAGALAQAYVEEALARDSDDGSLDDFLGRLQQRPPAVGAADVSGAEPAAAPAPAVPDGAAATADPPVAGRRSEIPTAARLSSAASPPALPAMVAFTPGDPTLTPAALAALRQLARQVAGGGHTVVVSGGGLHAGLARERARRVAAALVDGGLAPTRIAIEMGGERDVVVVYETDA